MIIFSNINESCSFVRFVAKIELKKCFIIKNSKIFSLMEKVLFANVLFYPGAIDLTLNVCLIIIDYGNCIYFFAYSCDLFFVLLLFIKRFTDNI